MNRFLILILTLGIWVFPPIPGGASPKPDVQTILPALLQQGTPHRLECRGELVCSLPQIPTFYRQRGYQPGWSADGRMLPAAHELLKALHDAPGEGLNPQEYHLEAIQALWSQIHSPSQEDTPSRSRQLAELDILLSDAFLLYADHLRAGRVNPETIHTAWIAHHPQGDLTQQLSTALAQNSVRATLDALAPPHPGYQRLKAALATLRAKVETGSWATTIPMGATLRPGDRDPRILDLRRRLVESGDLVPNTDPESNLFDIPLMTAVAQFQRRHGLKADGVVGRQTLATFNTTLGQRIRQIELNLERWRWIPHDLGMRHIRVNIADFNLQVMEAGEPVLAMKVVVGRDYRRTPVFSDTLQYLVFNPYWNVPFTLAVKDKLPLILEDPNYLADHHFRVFAGWQQNAPQVDPATVDWTRLNKSNFRYRLRQDPGPHNALGQIKFMFPNPFAVYLHDTSEKDLFSREVRTFSSGCIRVADPLGLAAYVLQNQPPWSRERIQAAIQSRRHKVVNLKQTLPVHLLYWTAWAAADGTLYFRNDIYQRDPPLNRALHERLNSISNER